MADVKATQMLLKADLQCDRCYRKIKRLLCGCDQIRDQMFDEKQGLVRITVFCCSPEKIRQRLLRKGGCSIKSIEIVPPPPSPSKPKSDTPQKTQEKAEKEKPKAGPEKPKLESQTVIPVSNGAPPSKPSESKEPKELKEPKKPKEPEPVIAAPVPVATDSAVAKMVGPGPMMISPMPAGYQYPVGCGYPQQYGYPGGVAYYPGGGYGMGVAAAPVYYDGYGRPMVGNCCDYFSEENPSTCSVM